VELLAIISELAETISAIGGTALAAAFTSDQYDLLKCIFFCAIDSDGRVSVDALAIIEAQITSQLNTTAALITNAILFVQGEVGLSNAGSVGSETGDCDDCVCCNTFDVTYDPDRGGGVPANPTTVEPGGTYTFIAQEFPGFPGFYSLLFCLSCCLEVTSASGTGTFPTSNHVLCGATDFYHGELVGECFQRINYGNSGDGPFSITLTFGIAGCGAPSDFGCT
jgi:hypothetical protein